VKAVYYDSRPDVKTAEAVKILLGNKGYTPVSFSGTVRFRGPSSSIDRDLDDELRAASLFVVRLVAGEFDWNWFRHIRSYFGGDRELIFLQIGKNGIGEDGNPGLAGAVICRNQDDFFTKFESILD